MVMDQPFQFAPYGQDLVSGGLIAARGDGVAVVDGVWVRHALL